MKHLPLCMIAGAALAASAVDAAAQSEEIYNEDRVATFTITFDNAADWQAIVRGDAVAFDSWYPTDMKWESGGTVENVPRVGVRASGAGWCKNAPKQSIRLAFNELDPYRLGGGNRRWKGVNRIKLDSMIGNTDKAMMRDRVAYSIYRRTGAPASRSCHALLYVDIRDGSGPQYKGVYEVEEPIRMDMVRRWWSGERNGNLYKVPPSVHGIYDYRGPDQGAGPTTYVSDKERERPFTAEENYPGGNYQDVAELCNVLNNTPADQMYSRLGNVMNVDAFLLHVACTVAIQDADCIAAWWDGTNNHFWYHRDVTNRLEVIRWDPANSQGMPTEYRGGDAPIYFKLDLGPITRWIEGDPQAKAKYKDQLRAALTALRAVRDSGYIDKIYNQIRADVERDTLKGKWEQLPNGFTNQEFLNEVAFLKDWHNSRIAYLESILGAPSLPTVTIAASDASAGEPSNPGVFTITRTGSIAASLTVNRTRSGTATSPDDYDPLPSPITIPAGQASVTVTVTPVDDTAVEGNETVILTLSPDPAYTVGGASSATVTIADNDTAPLPTVTIVATDPDAAEPSNVGVFTVTRTGATTLGLTVQRVRSGTAISPDDYNPLPSPFVIPAGQASVTITVTPVDDTAVEGPETMIVTLSPDPAYTVGTASSATVTIADNDSLPTLPTVTIAATDPNAAEPANVGVFTVTRTGSTTAALTVQRTRTGTATSPDDYNPLPSPIVIPAGQASVTVTVTPVDDTAAEGNETVILTVSSDPAYSVGSPSSATVTIADNDSAALPTVTIAATDPNAAEPTSVGVFTVSRTGSTSAALTVVCARTGTATSGTDYQALPSTIVIPAGASSVTVTVTPIDDTAVEGNETVILTLTADPAYTVGAFSSATVTIGDNDSAALPTVTITATDPNAAEPTNVGVFTVSRTGSTSAALTVVRARTGTATSGTDFTALPSPIIIPAGQTSVAVTVTPIDDTAVEGNETVILTLSADPAYTVGASSSATVTITDNDSAALPTVTIAATDPNAAEPTSVGVFTVSRTGSTGAALTVIRARTGTATSGTDFTALPSPIIIPAGQSSVTVTVTPIDDTVDEGNETVILTLTPDPAYTVGAPSSATVTIADDDSALPTVTITASDPNAAEPANVGVFTVSRTGSTANPLTVVRARTGTATSGSDFTALPSLITIPAGQSSVTVTVTPIDDTAVEGNETIILTLSPDPAYTVGASSSATVTIADDDAAGGGLSATYYDNPDFTGASVTRTDPVIDFDWAAGSPAPAIGPDTFSARWTGRVQAQYTELYTFYTFTNDGVRLWVEGELLVDKWVQQSGGIEWSGQVALQAGQWYTIQMDYYENAGNGVARLLWSSPSTPKAVIPAARLDAALGPPDSRDNDGDGVPNDSDFDDDNDGIPDLQDPDRDGDGVMNLVEHSAGTDPDDWTSPAGGAVALMTARDNSNGDAWINDRCAGGSIGAGGSAPALWIVALLAIGCVFFRRSSRK